MLEIAIPDYGDVGFCRLLRSTRFCKYIFGTSEEDENEREESRPLKIVKVKLVMKEDNSTSKNKDSNLKTDITRTTEKETKLSSSTPLTPCATNSRVSFC